MTEDEKQQLSREVAALYKRHPFRIAYIQEYDDLFDCFRLMPVEIWLANDSAEIAELCSRHFISTTYGSYSANCQTEIDDGLSKVIEIKFDEKYTDHSSRLEASNIAAMKALKAKKEGERC